MKKNKHSEQTSSTRKDYWHQVWERKGLEETRDLKLLDGYEATNIDSKSAADNIIDKLDIKETSTLLDVGCGAGMIAQHLGFVKQYVGVDYSASLVKKHIEILGNSVLVCDAESLIFKDKSFDKVICHGVFLYFDNHEVAKAVTNELLRVAKEGVYISCVAKLSHRKEHLLFEEAFFEKMGGTILPSSYSLDRFDIIFKIN